jgi:DNA-binding NtrC family response regulator
MDKELNPALCNGDAEAEAAWLRGPREPGVQIVLLVEDEAFVRRVASEVLRGAGYCVLIARDASEAACLYESCHGAVDLLLTDLVLPGEDGCALAARLQAENSQLSVLLMSGYTDRREWRDARRERDQPWLAKPFSGEQLLGKVRQTLSRSGLPAEPFRRACGSGLRARPDPESATTEPRG